MIKVARLGDSTPWEIPGALGCLRLRSVVLCMYVVHEFLSFYLPSWIAGYGIPADFVIRDSDILTAVHSAVP